ncbi:MAG: hypothetical protein WA990_08030 [Rubrobacteraceae bacterium]
MRRFESVPELAASLQDHGVFRMDGKPTGGLHQYTVCLPAVISVVGVYHPTEEQMSGLCLELVSIFDSPTEEKHGILLGLGRS